MSDRLEDVRERLKIAKLNWSDLGSRELVYFLMVLAEEIHSLKKRIDKLEPKSLEERLKRLQEDIGKGGC